MTYEIKSKSDFQIGTILTVRIPEADLDQKAVRTIQADRPPFLIPYRYRFVDGEVEFTYQIGNRSKLAYLSGNRSPSEYAEMWCGLLQPLLDCSDWFMDPGSFVLSPEYLYCDKGSSSISFVYIPSVQPCSDADTLKQMVMDVAKMNHVTDINFENKVIWAIQDFNIVSFLQLIKASRSAAPEQPKKAVPAPAPQAAPARIEEKREAVLRPQGPAVQSPPPAPAAAPRARIDDDICIQLPSQAEKDKKEKKGWPFGHKKEKEKKEKNKGGMFQDKKKPAPAEIVGGAAAQPYASPAAPAPGYGRLYGPNDPNEDATSVLSQKDSTGPRLRYIGVGEHPRSIKVSIGEGALFTIGRVSQSAGIGQSNFEFHTKTKEVSRRHAAIERKPDGYYIVDLNSSFGTFLNGQKLPPNAPFLLEPGCRVSFGLSGVDYVWEN